MSPLSATLETIRRGERQTAVRHLLRHPLTLARDAPDAFAAVVRHRGWLTDWFAEQPGWKLLVNPSGGFARLHKVAAETDATRPARLSGRPAFDRRRYVLLSLALAALDDSAAQTTIKRLAGLVEHQSRGEDGVAGFDPNLFSERRAFVDVLRFLAEHGVLGVRDGDADRWAQDESGDALYDVNERLLGQLLAAPVPPALAGDPAGLRREEYPETDEGEKTRARHRVFRRLLDEPVVYYEDLPAREYEWLDHSRGFVYARLEDDVRLPVERRREGLAAVDPEGELSDTLFPDGGSTVKHAALLLAERLARHVKEQGPAVDVGDADVLAWTGALMIDYGELCHWSRLYPLTEDGTRRLAAEAMELLAAFRLASRVPRGWRPRPAIARFAPAAPRAGVP